MSRLMRCLYCGLLQDEPAGVKTCARCGGELAFEAPPPPEQRGGYVQAQMELDQVVAPAGRNVDRHLLITLRTPAQVPPEEAAPTETGRQPLHFAAVLDVSGSMRGQKLEQAKEAVRQALSRLHDGDVFTLVTFDSNVRCVFEPAEISMRSRHVVESALCEVRATGMTALCGGLEMGMAKVAAMKRETNLLLLLSDGQANVGETDVEKVGYRGYQARQQGIVISTLGVGADYNEALMAEIATQGGGRFYHVMQASQIGAYLTGELGEIAALAAREVEIALTLPAGATVVPLAAAYPAGQSGERATVAVGDIPAATELEIPLRLTLPAQPPEARLSVEGSLSYKSPAGNHLQSPLNRVTVRFKEAAAFVRQEGVVIPVVERVLGQMKATSVLGMARAAAKSEAEGLRQADLSAATIREYAALLGEERAEQEAEELAGRFAQMRAAPDMAKATVASAFGFVRATKKFDG